MNHTQTKVATSDFLAKTLGLGVSPKPFLSPLFPSECLGSLQDPKKDMHFSLTENSNITLSGVV